MTITMTFTGDAVQDEAMLTSTTRDGDDGQKEDGENEPVKERKTILTTKGRTVL